MPTTVSCVLFRASLILKLGLFPAHVWFISFISGGRVADLWWVSVPQKILPFWVSLFSRPLYFMVLASTLFGVLIRVIRGIKASRLNTILGYSSLLNRSWFILLLRDLRIFLVAFILYGISLGGVVHYVGGQPGKYGFSNMPLKKRWLRLARGIVLFINLGGLPPFLNMWGKIFIVIEIMKRGRRGLILFFILRSGVFLYLYLRVRIWGGSLILGGKTNWKEASPGVFPTLTLLVLSGLFFFS